MTIIRHLALMAIKGAHIVTALRYSVENYNTRLISTYSPLAKQDDWYFHHTMLLIGIVAQRPNMPNGN